MGRNFVQALLRLDAYSLGNPHTCPYQEFHLSPTLSDHGLLSN
jgi:hypothetical protein